MLQVYRHGELAFIKIKSIPKGLKETKTKIIEKGSHNHSFNGGKLYLLPKLKDWTLGYFEAKDTILYHSKHGNEKGEAKLPNGIYEIRKHKKSDLQNYTILDEQFDDLGKPMTVFSFKIKGKPLKLYHCFDATKNREYFIKTDKNTCKEAKEASFGLSNVKWLKEW